MYACDHMYVHMYICTCVYVYIYVCMHVCHCVYDHHKGSQGTQETLTKLLWLAMTWYFIPAREWSCFPQWWQVNISWKEKSLLSAGSPGEKQKVTKCHQLGQASLCHFFLVTCYGLNLMSSTGSCVEHLVPSWCHCFGRSWGLAGGGWLGVGLLTPALCPDSTAMWKALTQAPGTPGESLQPPHLPGHQWVYTLSHHESSKSAL